MQGVGEGGGLATKSSVWCGEVTAQKHLFLINLVNQFGSSKPIPLTGEAE